MVWSWMGGSTLGGDKAAGTQTRDNVLESAPSSYEVAAPSPGAQPAFDYSNYQVPSIPAGYGASDVSLQSPYYNIGSLDPKQLSSGGGGGAATSGQDYLFEDAGTRQRSFQERACLGTGVAYLIGTGIGSTWGLADGLRHQGATSARLKVTTVLNGVTKRGPAVGNALGVLALMYNSLNYFAVSARGGSDDVLNQLACGSITGALFKSTAGPRSMAAAAIAGGVFVGLGTVVEAVLRGGDIPNPVEKLRERVYE